MAEFIIQSRIIPPGLPDKIISRPRLLSALKNNVGKSLILICAPAGSGKTTLLQEFLQFYKIKYSWVSVPQDLSNFYLFISYLVESLRKINDKFGELTYQTIAALKENYKIQNDLDEIIEKTIGNFINDFLSSFKEDAAIVIDDFHNLNDGKSSEWLNKTFNMLFENIPSNLHIYITTRAHPEFNINKLISKRKMFILESRDINLNYEEVETLLSEIYSVKSEPSNIKELNDKISGWVTGIHLIMQVYGKDYDKIKMDEKNLPVDVFNFFVEEIFSKFDNSTQNFLIKTSMLENFDPGICDYILNKKDSKTLIDTIIKKNIFMQSISDGSGKIKTGYFYNYNPLFKTFLNRKLGEILDDKAINDLLIQISNYYYKQNEIINAIDYSLKAHDFRTAEKYIVNISPSFINKGNYEIILKWMNAIPENYIMESPFLCFNLGRAILQSSGREASVKYVDRAVELFKKNNDIINYSDSKLVQIENYLSKGEYEKVISELNNLNNFKVPDNIKSKIYYESGRANYSLGKYDEAAEDFQNSFEISKNAKISKPANDNLVLTDIYNSNLIHLGNIFLIKGDFVKALFYYDQINENSISLNNKVRILIYKTFVYSYSGEFEKARECSLHAEELLESYPFNIYISQSFYYSKAILFNSACDYEVSEKILDEIKSKFLKAFTYSDYFHFYQLKVENYFLLGKYDKTMQYLEVWNKYVDNDDNENLYNIFKAILLGEKNSSGEKESLLLKSLRYYQLNKRSSEVCLAGFHLADHYLKENMPETSAKYISDFLNQCSEKQFLPMVESKIFSYRRIFDTAVSANLRKDFIKTTTNRVLKRYEVKWLSNEAKERLKKQSENFYDINMTSLGKLEFKTRGEIIVEDNWTRKKGKLILAYLLCSPETKLYKDKIIDIFFPELTVEKAEPLFYNAVTNIRNVLKGSKSNKNNIQYIIYEDKTLSLNPDYYYKSDINDFNSYSTIARSDKTSIENKLDYYKKAIDLYEGDFSPGYYDTWCEDTRQETLNRFISVSRELINILKKENNLEELITYSNKLLTIDKFNEEIFLDLIKAYIETGQLNLAKKRYSNMLELFQKEFNSSPSPNINERIKKLLNY